MISRKLFFALLLAATCMACNSREAAPTDSPVGVWADATCEVVRTERFALLFERDSTLITSELHRLNGSEAIRLGRTVFGPDSVLLSEVFAPADSIPADAGSLQSDGTLHITIGGRPHTLTRIERFAVVPPYEMPHASPLETGSCIQQWRLGVRCQTESEQAAFEANTNRHSYCFYILPGMVYCRAARLRFNDRGGLFAQNIRLMHNGREHTAFMVEDNRSVSAEPLTIDDSKFKPDQCVFDREGIYWSFIRFDGDTAELNGCGETYRYTRPEEADRDEWIAFEKY